MAYEDLKPSLNPATQGPLIEELNNALNKVKTTGDDTDLKVVVKKIKDLSPDNSIYEMQNNLYLNKEINTAADAYAANTGKQFVPTDAITTPVSQGDIEQEIFKNNNIKNLDDIIDDKGNIKDDKWNWNQFAIDVANASQAPGQVSPVNLPAAAGAAVGFFVNNIFGSNPNVKTSEFEQKQKIKQEGYVTSKLVPNEDGTITDEVTGQVYKSEKEAIAAEVKNILVEGGYENPGKLESDTEGVYYFANDTKKTPINPEVLAKTITLNNPNTGQPEDITIEKYMNGNPELFDAKTGAFAELGLGNIDLGTPNEGNDKFKYEQKIREWAYKNNIKLDDAAIASEASKALSTSGTYSDTEFNNWTAGQSSSPYIIEKIAEYPKWAEFIKQGYTVRDLASSYINNVATIYGVDPMDVGLEDPMLAQAIESGMTVSEHKAWLRQQPGYENSEEAAGIYSSAADAMQRAFGL